MIPAAEVHPPQPPQPHRPSTSCDRHPEERFTGFCPLCLCERLAVLDPSSSSSSSARKPPTTSTATAALKAIFKHSSSGNAGGPAASDNNRPSNPFLPELRRTKSFSASKNEGFSGVFEPQRKSCDVRGRNTLWFLFNQDDERNPYKKEASGACGDVDVEYETRNLGSSSRVRGPVVEANEEDESDYDDYDEIRVREEPNVGNVIEDRVEEIVEEDEEVGEPELESGSMREDELKSTRDHIDIYSQTKKLSGRDLKEIAGSFWSAASVFSKKWQKWRQKQKLKKRRNGGASATLPVEKPIERQFRETQSEIADYGFGRRSCDTDPRFSLDAARISLDDPRYSFDEPRASWDGHFIGRTFSRVPTMLSVVEDAPVHVLRSDAQIPVEEPRISINEDDTIPGGSSQTRDYYSDSSRRRRSFDRSNSIRKAAAAVVAEIDEMKSVPNVKVTPSTTDLFAGPKLLVPDRVLRDFNSNSTRDDYSETYETNFQDTASIVGNVERKGQKKSRRWSKAWNIWGLINRRNGNREEEEEEEDDNYNRPNNGVERSFSESWQARGAFNPKLLRSNSSVTWRNSFGKSSIEMNGNGRKKRDEFVLERNPSGRYSPTNIDNGRFRLYLTPMSNGRRNGYLGKNRLNQPHSISRSVLRLY